MLRAVIVDDEQKIVDMLMELVDWTGLGYDVAGTAHNGPDAYRLITEIEPDVAVVDARMPGYDGIEVVRRTRDSGVDTDFIVVSGYRYFEYAHNALKFGVEHYLLKPVDSDELAGALDKVAERRRVGRSRAGAGIEVVSRNALRRRLLQELLADGVSHRDMGRMNREYATEFAPGYFCAVYYRVIVESNENINRQPVLEKACWSISTALDRLCGESDLCIEHAESPQSDGVILLLNLNTDSHEAFTQFGKRAHECLSNVFDVFNCFAVVAGIGTIERDFARVGESMAAARVATRYYLRIKEPVISYGGYGFVELAIGKFYTPAIERKLIDAVMFNQRDNIRSCIRKCTDQICKVENYSPSAIYELATAVLASIDRSAQDYGIDAEAFAQTKLDFRLMLDRLEGEKQLIEGTIQLVQRIADIISNDKYLEYSKPIREARQYIDEHYREQIGLAEQVHLSSSYLSSVFRAEIGLSFSEYLTNCRVNEAKRLLRETDKTMAEIAEDVGYKDVKYFAKTFKKTVALRPSDFRKLYS